MQTERTSSGKRTAKLGNVLYWLGCIIAALIVGVAIALYVNEGSARSDDLPKVGFLILIAAIVWAIGHACRFVLAKT
jgi:formate/nitrite transporter FocA (FNT family)